VEQDVKEADQEQYLKRGTLAVLGVMKDLLRHQTPLLVRFPRGQFISRMLTADKDRLVFDLGSNNLDNDYALTSDDLSITAETFGAKVEFSLTSLERIDFEGLPAFSAPLPDLLWQIQRREFFRVCAPLEPQFSGVTPRGRMAVKRACGYRISPSAVLACWWMNRYPKDCRTVTASTRSGSSWANMAFLKCR